MNYHQTLDYMFSQLPMFQRVGQAAYKANLNNTIAICKILDNPYNNYPSIHIAGTNGKGSTSHFLASILQSNGLKVGLYTSPHLKDFRERIKINGRKILRSEVIKFIATYKTAFQEIKPSFFEMTAALAFKYFSDEKVDIAIIETGMGGRLDSTNVINPIVSVITNIGLDHTQFLGNTLQEIAAEKAAIIKLEIPVVIGEEQSSVKNIFIDEAKKNNSPLYFADSNYKAKNIRITGNVVQRLSMDIYKNDQLILKNLKSELTAGYQVKNIICALQVLELLNYNLWEMSIFHGISTVVRRTGINGRWQIIARSPLTICDIAHNSDGIKNVIQLIQNTPHNQLHFVYGTVKDKSTSGIMKLLPKDAIYYFCKADIPRALDQHQLFKLASSSGLKGEAYPSVEDALNSARSRAKKDDLIFIGGSTFVVAEIL
ncbi:MAG: bifunctional folylpolyglutamate synthase/dihydrofolate synthase [Bacteroidales bacterium]|nr:bifunctional folylpolyglutamate synthase/dihydrofolate synthase [Bacteroidales bacterium]